MISDEDLVDILIEDIRYTVDITTIPIIASVKIDQKLVSRLDIIINRYYSGNMNYLPLLMNFNNITELSEMQIGQILELPDMEILKEVIYIEKIDESAIPGIVNNTNPLVVNTNLTKTSTKTASARLKITLNPVTYNSESGIIKY